MACNEHRPRPHVGAGGDRRRRSRAMLAPGPSARRQARAGDVRPDARGDRSGALHLQPFLGQAGPRHRRGAGAPRRRRHAGQRTGGAGRSARPARRSHVELGRPDAGRLPGRRCRRCRRLRRRRRRLEGRAARPPPRSRRSRAPRRRRSSWPPIPDILATLSQPGPQRPALVIGFAAETENLVANAIDKRKRKGCDWIVANDVSPATGTFGGERNTVHLISAKGVEDWPTLAKGDVATRLAGRIALHLGQPRKAAGSGVTGR